LRDQGFSEPREKANLLIQQLRERNFILCYRGADTYGFMHRTFLEYFCAVEIVYRFEKQRTLTFEQLRDEIFGQHWQDETWHEVLRLICGAIDLKFAGKLIEFLLGVKVDRSSFLGSRRAFIGEKYPLKGCLKPEGIMNLLLAADCLADVNNSTLISQLENSLLLRLQTEIEQPEIQLTEEAANELLVRIAQCFPSFNLLSWLKRQILHNDWAVRRKTVKVIASCYQDDLDTLPWLKQLILQHRQQDVSHAAVWAIAENYKDNPDILAWLQQRAKQDEDWLVRRASMSVVFIHYKDALDILSWLKLLVLEDNDWRVQSSAVYRLVEEYDTYPDVLNWLEERVKQDIHDQVKRALIESMAEYHKNKSETLTWLKEKVLTGDDAVMKSRAICTIAENYQNEAEVLSWVKQQSLLWLKENVKNNQNRNVRKDCFEALTQIFEDDTAFFILVRHSNSNERTNS
jgi:hemoglobin-like flavoprotein